MVLSLSPYSRHTTLLPYPPTTPRLPMKTEINIGALYTHRLHGQIFIVGSADDTTVTILNTMEAKEYHVPVNAFRAWFMPYRRET